MKKVLPFVTIFLWFPLQNIMAQETVSVTLNVVTNREEIDLSDVDLAAFPGIGPCMLAGDNLHFLVESDSVDGFYFQEGFMIDNVVWAGEEFVIKSENALYKFDNPERPLMVFDTRNFDIFPWDDRRIFLVSHQHDTSNVFMCNMKVRRTKRILTLAENVIYVTPLDKATMVVTSENIYIFHDTECRCYLHLWTPLRTAVMTDKGLLFATDNELCILTGEDQFALLLQANVKQILYDGIKTYIFMEQGDLLKLEFD